MSEKNKLLSLFLCLLLVFSTFSSTEISYLGAVADEETNELPAIDYSDDSIYSDDLTDDNTYYIGDFCVSVLEDETLQIEGFSEWYETPSDLDSFSLEIPSLLADRAVTSIGYGAFEDGDFRSVTIPDSVTNIGDEAFYGCESLTSVIIPDSITSIGIAAFDYTGYYNNKSNWVNNVLYIDKYLISGIKYSENETSESVIGEYNVKQGTVLIADYAFADCEFLELVNFPDSLVYIGNGAFSFCNSLTKVEIPDSVIRIGDDAFSWCISLDTVKLGNGITEITDYAFFGDKYLSDITIPDSITSIGENAFTNCDNLTSIEVPASVKNMGIYAMGYYQVTSDEEFSIDYRKYSDFSIKGYTNSEAEKYANDNDITFIALDGENPTDPTEPTTPTQSTAKPTVTTSNQTPIGPSKPANTNVTTTTAKTTTKAVANSFKAPKVKAKASKGKISLTLKKVKGTAGYQVRYKVNGKWKVKTFKIKKNATKVIKKLKKGSYKVQIRLINNAKKPLSNWSKVKTVKVK